MICRTRSYRGHSEVLYDQLILIATRDGEMQMIVGNGWTRQFIWDDRTVDYDPEAAFFLINYHPICSIT